MFCLLNYKKTSISKGPGSKKWLQSLLAVGLVAGLFLLHPAGLASGAGLPLIHGGAIEGDFAPLPTGAAAFSVPIKVAPGIRGLQPSLALAYNSQNTGNSLTGIGWRLGGLSSIRRCGKRLPQETTKTAVTYTNSDRLCVDGMPLVARNSNGTDASYWALTQEYSKEVDDGTRFAKTINGASTGSCGVGFCIMLAYLPDGRALTYGASTASKIYTENGVGSGHRTIREWKLTETYDRTLGNRVKYIYARDYGYPRISRIEYDNRSVEFVYDAPFDSLTHILSFDGTGEVRMRHRLREIRVATADGVFKTYYLDYSVSALSGRNRMTKIEECDPSGCLDPLVLTWNNTAAPDGTYRVVTPTNNNSQDWLRSDPGANLIPGDYNGDGKTDFIRQEKNAWDDTVNWGNFMVWFSNGDGTFSYVQPNGNQYQADLRFDHGAQIIPGDFNGDGKTDFIRRERGGWGANSVNNFRVYLSRGNGYFDVVIPSDTRYQPWLREDMANIFLGDFNGDGKTDFLRQEKNGWDDTVNWGNFMVFFSQGDGNFTHVSPAGNQYQDLLRADPGANIIVGDYDGDGMSDFVRQERGGWDNNETDTFKVYFSKGDGTFRIVTPPKHGSSPNGAGNYAYQQLMRSDQGALLTPGDFNGDGKTDLLRQEHHHWGNDTNVGNFQVMLSIGNGYFEPITQPGANHQDLMRDMFGVRLHIVDYNGDGRSDILRQKRGNLGDSILDPSLMVHISRGDGYFDVHVPAGSNYTNHLNAGPGSWIIPGDYDGDGRSDFIRQEHGNWDNDTSQSFKVYFADKTAGQSGVIETIEKIEQGPVTHTLSYRRLSQYDPNANISFSAGSRGFRGPLAVLHTYSRSLVTAVQHGAAVQTTTRTYEFRGATIDTSGRGFQGFRTMIVAAPDENGTEVTNFYTAFPFAGRPEKIVSMGSSGAWISDVTIAMRSVVGSAPQSVRTQVAKRTLKKHAYGGVQRSISDFQYDSQGNLLLLTENDGGRTLETCSTYANDALPSSPAALTGMIQGNGCSVSGDSCSCSNRLTEFQLTLDGVGNITERKDYDSSRDAWLTTAYGYDSSGNRNRTTHPTGAVETIQFESTYKTYPETITTTAAGKTLTESRSFDARHGAPTEAVDANGVVSRTSYDNFGRPLTVHRTGPQGLVLVESHSYQRQLDNYTDVSQTRQSWATATMLPGKVYRDGLGRVVRQQSASGNEQRKIISIYNARGNLIRESIPYRSGSNQGWTTYGFNNRSQVIAINYPTGARATLAYGFGGVCESHQLRVTTATTGGVGRNGVRCRNARGKVEKLVMTDSISGASTTQEFSFDILDRFRGASNGQATTTIALDSLGRRTGVTSSDRGTIEYIYDAQGQLQIERNNGEDKTFVYDQLGREESITFHDGSLAEFEYDDTAFNYSKGRMTRAIMHSSPGVETSRREYSYSPMGEPAIVDLIMDGNSAGKHTMEYRNDPQGRPESVQYPSGNVACYTYNTAGHPGSIRLARPPEPVVSGASGDCADAQAETLVEYSNYTAQGQPGRVVYGNDVETDFTYDGVNRVETVRTLDIDNVALLDQKYTWTPLNEIDAIEDRIGDKDSDYTYNGFGYLTRAVGLYGDIAYEYDPAGNLKKKGDLTIHYNGSRPTGADDGLSLTYDSQGHGNVTNRTTAAGTAFQFNYNGRYKIETIAKNGTQAGAYEYDAGGDRVKKIDGNGNETVYVNRNLEITRFANNTVLSTEYIQGPSGRIAAISKQSNSVAMLHGTSTTHAMRAQMYNTGTVGGLVGFLNHTTMAYLRNPSVAATVRALFWAMATTTVIMAFAVYMIRTARNRSWLGRLRAFIALGLARSAWLRNTAAAESLIQFASAGEASGGYSRRRRLWRWPAPVLVATMLSMSMQCGSSNGGSNITIAPPGSDLFAFNFLLGPGGNGYGYPEAGTFYFQYNQVGSTSLVTDAAGKQAAYTMYKPYGEVFQDGSDGRDIFRGKFNNNEYDRDGEVHFFNARYYDASIGSFLQADTLAFGANDYHPAALNRYAFSGNNPVTYSDPGGNLFWFAFFIGAAVGALVNTTVYTVTALIGGTFTWEGFGVAFGIGLAGGAVGGGIAGALIGRGVGAIMAQVAGATVESFGSSIAAQLIEDGQVDWGTVLIDTSIGAAMGGTGFRNFGLRGVSKGGNSVNPGTIGRTASRSSVGSTSTRSLSSAGSGPRLVRQNGSRNLGGGLDAQPRLTRQNGMYNLMDGIDNVAEEIGPRLPQFNAELGRELGREFAIGITVDLGVEGARSLGFPW